MTDKTELRKLAEACKEYERLECANHCTAGLNGPQGCSAAGSGDPDNERCFADGYRSGVVMTHKCTTCGKSPDKTTFSGSGGVNLRKVCNPCRHKADVARELASGTTIAQLPVCTKCKQQKAVSEFGVRDGRRDTKCKACRSEDSKQYKLRKKDAYKAEMLAKEIDAYGNRKVIDFPWVYTGIVYGEQRV